MAAEIGDRMLVVEPFATELPPRLQRSSAQLVSLDDALEAAETVAILVDHTDFKHLSLSDFSGKQVYDTRGLLQR